LSWSAQCKLKSIVLEILLPNTASTAGQPRGGTEGRGIDSTATQQNKIGVGEKMKKKKGAAPNLFLSR
jgi:hypothetical protein